MSSVMFDRRNMRTVLLAREVLVTLMMMPMFDADDISGNIGGGYRFKSKGAVSASIPESYIS
jgi:hypothetical protein